mmetsp:Transcript_123655/g.219137  ORF Transcript_123655/g.219137 Transcript_123655/m.219137 type:complete len:213 (+) Transcript_123655:513-1151(+)
MTCALASLSDLRLNVLFMRNLSRSSAEYLPQRIFGSHPGSQVAQCSGVPASFRNDCLEEPESHVKPVVGGVLDGRDGASCMLHAAPWPHSLPPKSHAPCCTLKSLHSSGWSRSSAALFLLAEGLECAALDWAPLGVASLTKVSQSSLCKLVSEILSFVRTHWRGYAGRIPNISCPTFLFFFFPSLSFSCFSFFSSCAAFSSVGSWAKCLLMV